MATDIHKIIAAINPNIYCHQDVREEVKKIAAEKGYLAAAQKAKLVDPTYFDWNDIGYNKLEYRPSTFAPGEKLALKRPIQQYQLAYDASSESLETIYYWILDNIVVTEFRTVEKIIDNFISAPGSGHFSEMGAKATRMQEEGMKLLANANNVIRSILNIIYDLKEFKIRLAVYDDYRSSDPKKKQGAIYSLKQIWMDGVDIKKGTTSLKGLVQQFDYVTIIDAFMATNSLEELDKVDLNERVKRILSQRISEYNRWIEESERELRKRFEVEKIYLKSQVSAVQLYARWAKPYLKWARQLEQNASPTASLVNSFNTTLLELSIIALRTYDPKEDVDKDDLPKIFLKFMAEKTVRKYISIMLLELKYRSYPERTPNSGYGFRGRVDMKFTPYALSEEELKILKKELEKDDVDDVFRLVEGATTESLGKLKEDVDEFLSDAPIKRTEEKKKESKSDDNPFSALFSGLNFTAFKSSDSKSKLVVPDTDAEEIIRGQAIIEARKRTRTFYNFYKRMHAMPTI